MVASALVPIAVALAVIVIVPGPNVLAVTTTAMRDRRAGVLMALGVSAGDLVWAASALAGLGAILAHARPVFEAMRWAGAAYLLGSPSASGARQAPRRSRPRPCPSTPMAPATPDQPPLPVPLLSSLLPLPLLSSSSRAAPAICIRASTR